MFFLFTLPKPQEKANSRSSDRGGPGLGVHSHFLFPPRATAALSRAVLERSFLTPCCRTVEAMSFLRSYAVDTFLYLLPSRSPEVQDVSAPKGRTENSQEHTAPGDRKHGHSSCPTADRVVSPSVWGSVSVCLCVVSLLVGVVFCVCRVCMFPRVLCFCVCVNMCCVWECLGG